MKLENILMVAALLVFMAAILFIPKEVQAQAHTFVGPDCQFTWKAPTEGAPVEGYMLYLEQVMPYTLQNFDVGVVHQYDCAQLNLSAGGWKAWVTAYNAVGESESSNVVNFTIITSVPGSPTSVSVGKTPAP